METLPLPQIVEAARRREPDAFAELVARFQDMAVGSALAQLPDPELARDAAQEAFTEAFLRLDQLREPAAFPGWFRRIVAKHCDRIRRRRRPGRETALPEGTDPTGASGPATDSFERRLDHALVRRAIETLPEHERAVVALYYLSGESQDEIAGFLGISPGAVRKRLHSARSRLRKEMQTMWTEPLDRTRPSLDARFSRSVRLFVAVRTGDCDGVARLLDEDPELVHHEEDWDVGDAIEHGLPVPTRATPLIRAAERDDVAMVDLLIDRGAPVGGDCGCATGESALWAALVTGAARAARRLLERGADPNAPAARGATPLHVAAIRDLPAVVPALLAAGADPSRTDANGRTPADWARAKHHDAVLEALGHGPPARVTPTSRGRDAASPAAAAQAPWSTGIKAIDLFAPLAPGSLVECRGSYGVGRNVLLAELSGRAALAGAGSAVWAAWEDQPWDESELRHLLAETGLAEAVTLLRAAHDAPDAVRREVANRALETARSGAAPALLVLFQERGHAADVEAVLRRVEAPVVCIVTPPWQTADEAGGDAGGAIAPPFDARIRFDRALAEAKRFPAIDPLATTSRGAWRDREHRRRAEEARALLGAARELDPQGHGDLREFRPAQRVRLERARRLQAFLTQPFLTTESFVGDLGRTLSLDATLAGVGEILDGRCDAIEPVHFLYKGDLEDVHRSASEARPHPAPSAGAVEDR